MKKIIIISGLVLLFVVTGISTGLIGMNWDTVQTFLQEQVDTNKTTRTTTRLIDEESVVIDVIEDVSPSVVTVGVERERPVFEYDPRDPFGFFGGGRRQSGVELEEADIGSGFIISDDGLIVTNRHVVDDNLYEYKVFTSDNQEYKVENIYRDPANDLAILKIDASDLEEVELGDSDNLKVGQTVIALGTPLGEFRGTATKGIVSGLGRGLTASSPAERVAEELDGVIQTDAAINPGNSGGPLLNTSGQVIGVNTAVASGAENIGFALPINIIKQALDSFEESGSFDRAFLGVSYQMISRETAIMNEIPEGAYVIEVVEDSGADKAGLKKGDIITRFEGERIKDEEGARLSDRITQKRTGDTVTITVWRDGEEEKLETDLGEYNGL